MYSKPAVVVALLACFVATSCSSEKSSWKRTQEDDTVQAYQSFLKKYPQGDFTRTAIEKVEQLEFAKAETENTIEAYEAFVSNYPQAAQAEKANRWIEDYVFNKATETTTVESLSAFLKRFPNGNHVKEARAKKQMLLFGFEAEVLSLKPGDKEISGFGQSVTVTDPEHDTSLICALKFRFGKKPEKTVDSSKLEATYSLDDKPQTGPCMAMTLMGKSFWIFNEVDKGRYYVFHGQTDESIEDFLFIIPKEAIDLHLWYDNEPLAGPYVVADLLKKKLETDDKMKDSD